MRPSRLFLTLALVTAPVAVAAAPATRASLAKLRVEVDEAADALEAERATARDELAALRAERAELERQVRAAKARANTLQKLHAEARTRSEQLDAEDARWDQPTREAIAAARLHVAQSLPFARTQRDAQLDAIERDLSAATPDHARAVERLLRFIEEEDAMGSEVAYTQQEITLEGTPQLVDVIRLGMAILYVRTADERFAWARRRDDAWAFELIDDPALVEVLQQRFAAHHDNDALGPAQLVIPPELPGARG